MTNQPKIIQLLAPRPGWEVVYIHSEASDNHYDGKAWHTLPLECLALMFPGADRKTKDSIVPPFILVFLLLVIFVCAFGYMTYRYEAEKRAWEKKRNQFNDRV